MRILKFLLLVMLVGLVAFLAGGLWVASKPLILKEELISFRIAGGSGLRTAARTVEAAGVEMPAWQLAGLGRLLGRSTQIKAGSYEIRRGLSAMDLLDILTRGDVSRSEVVLVEGRNFWQLRELLDQHPDLEHASRGLTDAEILRRLGAPESHPEGLFFPDTYLVDKGSSDLDVLRRAYTAMQRQLAEAWGARDPALPLKTPYEMLILASIVEKETGQAADRGQIAAVFVNRLRTGMLLQTDPTVIYGLGQRFDGNLRKRDLQADSPWNTYVRPGLPPTPIAMPGLASLMAASRPPESKMLYFVARGDGSSHFSGNLDDHNRAVNRYQRGGRQ